MESQNILKKYIESILKLQEENKSSPLSLEELNRLHEDLGLDHEDLKFIDQKFSDYFQRGVGFVRYQDWDRAIDELEQAVQLKPLHIEVLYHLAEAYQGRSIKKKTLSDKKKALYYAERCLQSDAKNERALYLISQLRRGVHVKSRQQAYFKMMMLGLAALIVILGGYLIWDEYHKTNKLLTPAPKVIERSDKSMDMIPVEIRRSIKANGFEIDLESSLTFMQSNQNFYQLTASLINKQYNIDFLKARILIKDERQNIIEEFKSILLTEQEAELISGDLLPIVRMVNLKQGTNPVAVEIIIDEIGRILYQEEDLDTRSIEVNTNSSIRSDYDVIIQERYQTIQAQPDQFEHHIILQYTNQGNQPVKDIKIEVQWYDHKERLIFDKEFNIFKDLSPALKTGQRRRVKIEQIIPLKVEDFEDYKIKILEIK